VDVPGWICHNNVKFSQNFEVEVSHITVDPLCMKHSFLSYDLLLCNLRLLILLDIVNQLAVWVMTSIQMWAVSEALIGLLVDDCSEMLFGTECMSFSLLAAITRAVVTIL